MADSPDELDPTQATEAKLCAYLEGTLSAGERVEIEKYLTQSPTHRKLLRDLAATREWVSNLPKELAPPEIVELFEQHAERTMLLDDSASAVSVSVNRGPQVMLAAAILLLAVGLGSIIFIVLNAKGPTAQNYVSSMKMPSTAATTVSSAPIPGTVARSIVTSPPPAAAPMPSDLGGRAPTLPSVKPPTTMPVDVALAKVPTTMMANASATTQSFAMQNQAMAMPQKSVLQQPATAMVDGAIAMNQAFTTAAKPVVKQAPATTVPATQSATVFVGDRLSIDIPQLVGPGVEKTTTVRVENDGKITLPMLDAMPAAGTTTTDLQKQIADRYRQENLIANPIVTVTKVSTMSSTMPTTKPSTAPATQPSH